MSAPVEALPLVALLPLQPPEAVHDVAWVVLHISAAELPCATLAGLELSETVGFGAELELP